VFDRDAWQQYLYWQSEDMRIVARINMLIAECQRHPFTGIGKPEPLRQQLAGWWSRRITGEHRFVYRVSGTGDTQRLEILSCRFHY
jgi:toxin YoeB